MRYVFLLVFLSVLDLSSSLTEFLDSYEKVNYKPISNSRKKRSTSNPDHLRFSAHNRSFHLILLPLDSSSSIFDHNVIFDVNGADVAFRPNNFLVEGYDKNNVGSSLHGSIQDGRFDGIIYHTDGTVFTLSRVDHFFSPTKRPTDYHSIIYSDDSINYWAKRRKRSFNSSHSETGMHGCGFYGKVKENMEHIQNSIIIEENHESSHYRNFLFDDNFSNKTYDSIHNRYSTRQRRSAKIINGKQIYPVRACYIYLQADQKLYQHIYENEGNSDGVRTREEIASLFYNHIKAVNQIYEGTNFNGIYGINFVIQRISLYTPETCENGKSRGTNENPFCDDNVDVSNFLNLNSRKNHSDFCLAYAFTYRDFVGGTLGLAWVASPNHNTAGGICQQYTKYSEGTNFVYRSLNTGIITLVNYGARVPNRVSQLTLAHEIGHNFGSPHDFPLECQPGLPDGNYLMFASATSGDKHNNAKFSSCSIGNISIVLSEVLQQRPADDSSAFFLRLGGFGAGSGKRNCFRETKSAFCGNQVKEPGEECDCGYTETDCKTMNDKCCFPRETGFGCKRIASASCSPSEGPCCDASTCAFHKFSANKVCRGESECLEEQGCNGHTAECPESVPKKDGKACQDSTKVCNAGSCNGSVCAEVGLKDCFLTKGPPELLCHLACEDANGTCKSSLHLPQFAAGRFVQVGRLNKSGIILLPGSPCNNYRGYCDIFRKCRSVDADGPLARLKNVIFNPKTFHEVRYWIQVNWWVVVLGGLGLLLFMAIFIKCCAVHTPSTNPNKAPALNIYDTLRRPRTLIHRPRNAGANELHVNGNLSTAHPSSHRNRQNNQPSRSARSNRAVLYPPPQPVISAPSATNMIVVEPPPPPPYPSSSDPAVALGGPKRGRRREKKENSSNSESRVKNRRR